MIEDFYELFLVENNVLITLKTYSCITWGYAVMSIVMKNPLYYGFEADYVYSIGQKARGRGASEVL